LIIGVISSLLIVKQKSSGARDLKKNMARETAIFLARELTGESGSRIGEFYGDISGAAVTNRFNCLSKQIKEN
jgi:chromosomal replication initiation ATPase DnaA